MQLWCLSGESLASRTVFSHLLVCVYLSAVLTFLQCNGALIKGKCVVCGGVGVSDAYYCYECTVLEKDRDGCPKIINVGTARIDLVYEKKKYKR